MRKVLPVLVLLGALAAPRTAPAQEYDPLEAGHPVRIAAYVIHPVGVILDRLIFRPSWWIGTKEPFRTLFGVVVPPAEDLDAAPYPHGGAGEAPASN